MINKELTQIGRDHQKNMNRVVYTFCFLTLSMVVLGAYLILTDDFGTYVAVLSDVYWPLTLIAIVVMGLVTFNTALKKAVSRHD